MIQVVTAAWANLQDPNKSTVAGKVNAAVLPGLPGKTPGVAIGNWHFSVPKNIPADRQKADLAFFKWFLTKEAQKAYAEAGGIPVRTDVLAELSAQPKFAWMKAYSAGLQIGQQINGYAEGAAVEAVMGLRLNEALLGQKSPAQALNTAAKEINEIFTRSGRKTGMLAPLPE
jgi:multiple sugar transport system substrate-binding protein